MYSILQLRSEKGVLAEQRKENSIVDEKDPFLAQT